MEELIQQAVIAGSIFLQLLILLKRSSEKERIEQHDQHLLVLSKNYKILGLIMIGTSLVLLVLPLLIEDIFYQVSIPYVLLSALGTWLYLFGRNHYLKYDEVTIEGRNFKGKTQLICWTDLSQLTFNSLSGFYVLQDVNHRKIQFYKRLKGIDALLNKLKEQGQLKLNGSLK